MTTEPIFLEVLRILYLLLLYWIKISSAIYFWLPIYVVHSMLLEITDDHKTTYVREWIYEKDLRYCTYLIQVIVSVDDCNLSELICMLTVFNLMEFVCIKMVVKIVEGYTHSGSIKSQGFQIDNNGFITDLRALILTIFYFIVFV